MQISSVNLTENNINFERNLKIKGQWPKKMKEAFVTSPYVQKLNSGEKDVVARLSSHYVSEKEGRLNGNHNEGDIIYKIYISLVNEGFWSELADNLHLIKRKSITQNFHRERGLIKCFDEKHFKKFFNP